MKTQRTEVKVIRETKKALLVADAAGREGWIQRRWLAEDQTVAAATFERAIASAAERKAENDARRDHEAAEKTFRDADHLVRVVKQTEKAIATDIILEVPGGFEEPTLVWFPKSQCAAGESEGTAWVPGWLIRDREAAAAESYSPNGRGYYERHRWCKGEDACLLRGVEILETATV